MGFHKREFYYGYYYYYYYFNISNSYKNARSKYLIFLLERIIKEFLAICCHMQFDLSLVGIVEVADPSALFHLQIFNPSSCVQPCVIPLLSISSMPTFSPLFLGLITTLSSYISVYICLCLPQSGTTLVAPFCLLNMS